MFLTQLAAKQMIKQEQIFKSKGHIVNVGSCSAEVSSTSRGEYCVSKAAVSMLTTLFADRLAPEGILVNEVRPGVIATDMNQLVDLQKNTNTNDSKMVYFLLRVGEKQKMWQR